MEERRASASQARSPSRPAVTSAARPPAREGEAHSVALLVLESARLGWRGCPASRPSGQLSGASVRLHGYTKTSGGGAVAAAAPRGASRDRRRRAEAGAGGGRRQGNY